MADKIIKVKVGDDSKFKVSIDGVQGENGLSAYEIAVKNGFTGTEQEWLDALYAGYIDLTGYYSKSQVDTLLSIKSNSNHNHDDRYYTETEINDILLNYYTETEVNDLLTGKQDSLVSGTNIKTVNGQSLLGSGDLVIASGGLTNFTESKNTTAPNATVPVVSLTPNVSEINADIVIEPKGSGSFMLKVPDGTSSNGNKRGKYSIDLQTNLTSATTVVSGNYSAALGIGNTVAGNYCSAIGGQNVMNQMYCFAFGAVNTFGTTGTFSLSSGFGNTNAQPLSFSFGQYNIVTNTSNAQYGSNQETGAFAIGSKNTVTNTSQYTACFAVGSKNTVNTYNSYVFGSNNNITSEYCFVLGGDNTANSPFSTIVGYKCSTKGVKGAVFFGNGTNSAVGATQQGKYTFIKTTEAVAGTYSLNTDGSLSLNSSNIGTLQNNEVRAFIGTIIAKDTGNTGVIASWKVEGCIARFANAGSTVFIGTPTITSLGSSSSAGTNGYSISLVNNTTIGGLEVQFTQTGSIATKVVAIIDMTECM